MIVHSEGKLQRLIITFCATSTSKTFIVDTQYFSSVVKTDGTSLIAASCLCLSAVAGSITVVVVYIAVTTPFNDPVFDSSVQ